MRFKNILGLWCFRPLQEDIIQSVLQKQDTLLCFLQRWQIYLFSGTGISRRRNLYCDFSADCADERPGGAIAEKNIPAVALYSGLTAAIDITWIIVYLASTSFYTSLRTHPDGNISRAGKTHEGWLLAVDEAHCICTMGIRFPPPYLEIVQLRENFARHYGYCPYGHCNQRGTERSCREAAFRKPQIFQKSFAVKTYFTLLLRKKTKKETI
jgi:ATP-dependent DNA helicase RecQ